MYSKQQLTPKEVMLEFDQTLEDLVEFNYYVIWKSPENMLKRWLIYFLPFLVFVLLMYLTNGPNFATADIVMSVIALLSGFLLTPKLIKWIIKRDSEKVYNNNLISRFKYIFDENNIRRTGLLGQSEILLYSFLELVETKGYFYLFAEKNKAIIIPKRILGYEKYDLINLLKEKIPTDK